MATWVRADHCYGIWYLLIPEYYMKNNGISDDNLPKCDVDLLAGTGVIDWRGCEK